MSKKKLCILVYLLFDFIHTCIFFLNQYDLVRTISKNVLHKYTTHSRGSISLRYYIMRHPLTIWSNTFLFFLFSVKSARFSTHIFRLSYKLYNMKRITLFNFFLKRMTRRYTYNLYLLLTLLHSKLQLF